MQNIPLVMQDSYSDSLRYSIQQHDSIMRILQQLYLVDSTAYIAAGVIRNMLWSELHEQNYELAGTEVDVIFYHAEDDGSYAHVIQQHMQQHFPQIKWDVTNQALVHQWYRTENGERIAPLQSIAHALSLWPETATAIAVKLTASQQIEIVAPFGLKDLFELNLRWNPCLVSHAVFMQRVVSKQFFTRWPKLNLIDKDTIASA
ncbi:nucleotidyltransferase family protein [Acinetobacter bouvetii]|uniref:Nucleotidyltransferase family protein n=1 Tax=Acinetobacter bouvetii TaxID=202951 RepID=A0A811GCW3_9GAMM|nr:nucleotidyltransferase family protein [Acinetobacter bouvetii]CAB1220872.1 hypothetical protein SFB21_2676 [Acinetobacter bouvetii]